MKRVLFICGMLLCSFTSVFANENVLQTIEVVPVKDTYNLVLIADKAVDVKKTVDAPNKITLTLKNIRASKTLNTVYNNVSNVDTVMVEPQGNGVSIYFQADNAAGTSITFDSTVPTVAPVANKKQKIKLNSPIESYSPIYNNEFAKEKTSNFFNKLKPKTTVSEFDEVFDDEPSNNNDMLNKLFSLGLVAFLGLAVVKLFKRKENEIKIGLSQSLNEREINMYGGANPLQQDTSLSTLNYGLNAYQRENKNPYQSTPVQYHNPKLRSMMSQKMQNIQPLQNIQTMPAYENITKPVASNIAQQTQTMTRPTAVKNNLQSNANIDNLKFLESMTAIYEKSGRHDLAKGLKASLSKNMAK